MQSLSPQPLKTSQVTAGEGRLPKGNVRITRSETRRQKKAHPGTPNRERSGERLA